jgi:hypothetical protein
MQSTFIAQSKKNWMVKDQRRILVLVAVFFAGLLAGSALMIFFQSKSEPAPDTSKLQDLLQNTAQKSIGVPPLTDAGLELSIARDKLDKEVERIKSLAAKFGGTAIVGTADEKGAEVLAQISSCCANQFVEAVKHPEKEPVVAPKSNGEASALVEIRLTFQG